MSGSRDVPVCDVEGFAPGDSREFQVVEGDDNAKVLVFRTKDDGSFYATSHKCTHFGAPLVSGSFSGNRVVCPWHCASFCVKTGDIEDAPALDALRKYPARVEGGKVVVSVPDPFPEGFRRVPHLAPHNPDDDTRTFVIVGGGAAGAVAAQTLREDGFRGNIKLLCAEPHYPYDRIHVSKALKSEATLLRSPAFWAAAGVEVRLSTRVTSVDTVAKAVHTESGDAVKYDKLLVATGCVARRLTVPGGDLPNVFTVRNADDAGRVVAAIAGADNVVIIGTSFIGVEVAAAIKGKNESATLTMVGIESVPFERVLGVEIGTSLKKWCEEKGLTFKMNANVARIVERDGAAVGVELATGEVLPASVVVAGVGAIPQSPLTAENGVEIGRDGGVTCDETFQAAPDVYVAGDIARLPLWLAGGAPARIEHWCVAEQHGRIAARNMNGHVTPYRDVPFFWTMVFGKGIRFAGYGGGYDELIVDGDIAALKAVVYYVKAGVVTSVATMASDPAAAAIVNILKNGVKLTADAVRASLGEPVPIWKRLSAE